MRIDNYLQLNQDYFLNQRKEKVKKAEELKEIAWKTLEREGISAFDYIEICRKNNVIII